MPVIHELFPYLRVRDAGAAIDFYREVFGVTELFRLVEPSGRIGHAELQFGPAVLMLSEEYPELDLLAPDGKRDPGVSLHLHVDDCDTLAARAVAAGATMLSEPRDEFYGERGCRLRDPFGHTWLIGHSIEKVEPEEMQRRYSELMTGAS